MSLEDDFPNLKDGHFRITSPQDVTYNCMAWAMEDVAKWWEPTDAGYWPSDMKDGLGIHCYVDAFKSFGFFECETSELEDGLLKIAGYVHDGEVTHIARQLESGKWTSKLGSDVDVEHELAGLEGEIMGCVNQVFARAVS